MLQSLIDQNHIAIQLQSPSACQYVVALLGVAVACDSNKLRTMQENILEVYVCATLNH